MSNYDKSDREDLKDIQRYVNKFPLFTPEEEKEVTCEYFDLKTLINNLIPLELLYSIRLPDNQLSYIIGRMNSLEDEIINRNLRLVLKACRSPSYQNRGLSTIDLFMEGYDGLRYSTKVKYDPHMVNPKTNRPNKFSTYTTYWIKQRIGRAIEKKGSSIKIAGHIQSIMSKIRQVVRKYVEDNKGEKPSAETIVDLLHKHYPNNPGLKDITAEKVAEYGRLDWQISSLDEEVSTDDGNSVTLVSFLPAPECYEPEVEYEAKERLERIFKSLDLLNDYERIVIAYHYGLLDNYERSLKQISRLIKRPLKDIQSDLESGIAKLKDLAAQGLYDGFEV